MEQSKAISKIGRRGIGCTFLVLLFFVASRSDAENARTSVSVDKALSGKTPGHGIQYDNNPPVHGWIAYRAYALLDDGSEQKIEMSGYIPSDSSFYGNPFTPPASWGDNYDAPANSATAIIRRRVGGG